MPLQAVEVRRYAASSLFDLFGLAQVFSVDGCSPAGVADIVQFGNLGLADMPWIADSQ